MNIPCWDRSNPLPLVAFLYWVRDMYNILYLSHLPSFTMFFHVFTVIYFSPFRVAGWRMKRDGTDFQKGHCPSWEASGKTSAFQETDVETVISVLHIFILLPTDIISKLSIGSFRFEICAMTETFWAIAGLSSLSTINKLVLDQRYICIT
ncbi:unnamed protein product [Kuraishia capsulata CBS 1993]|uniref:Uncharacterized protein n=1 Tax=Kuraishia capsulata CBS 1993 TaxID=1382522 RepID=W6MS47_9ASCO|nr:uncharacterized protein KUCA_T00000611001 [Kuraishia capsulata CBS 1993]CDK24645.1 unnamed protein product [Kuraishia capsulata CBS 1993]